jgi:hypothetical protein
MNSRAEVERIPLGKGGTKQGGELFPEIVLFPFCQHKSAFTAEALTQRGFESSAWLIRSWERSRQSSDVGWSGDSSACDGEREEEWGIEDRS